MTQHNWHRKPPITLLEGCGHKETEDCLNCAVCGRCSESLDADDVSQACRTQEA
jgi:hypothetical protein